MVGTRRTAAKLAVAVATVAIMLAGSVTDAHAAALAKVTAVSYRFIGVPKAVEADVYHVRFTNAAVETPHELVAIQVVDGATLPQVERKLDEVFATGEIDPHFFLAFAGAAAAPPGKTVFGDFDVSARGTYAYFCGIATERSNFVPHYKLGMLGLFKTVLA